MSKKPKTQKCRACGKPLPDPLLADDMNAGVDFIEIDQMTQEIHVAVVIPMGCVCGENVEYWTFETSWDLSEAHKRSAYFDEED